MSGWKEEEKTGLTSSFQTSMFYYPSPGHNSGGKIFSYTYTYSDAKAKKVISLYVCMGGEKKPDCDNDLTNFWPVANWALRESLDKSQTTPKFNLRLEKFPVESVKFYVLTTLETESI